MNPFDLGLVALAGVAAGLINNVVGSGTLVTFPTLLALGVPPVVANTSNTVGLVPGGIASSWSYRPELAGQRGRVIRLGIVALIGGVIGAVLLLTLPSGAFETIVPILIGLGVVLVLMQPWLAKKVAARRRELGVHKAHGDPLWTLPAVLGSSVYGGYFGAAQGVLLLAILGIGVDDTMPRMNAVKNVLGTLVNAVAAVVFIVVSPIDWWAAGAIAVGSIIGAWIGTKVGRRLPPTAYRIVIAVVGVVAIVTLLVRG